MKGNKMSDFNTGVDDAKIDLSEGWVFNGGPTERPTAVGLDYIVNELRMTMNASDSYIAGYLSVVFGG